MPKAVSTAAIKPSTLPKRITKSTQFTGSKVTRRADAHENGAPEGAALVVRGDHITVDFGGRILEGTPPETVPDKRKGTGILVSGKNVTIKNARVRGYKIGVFAQNAPGLRLINCDVAYNWKQHLKSTLEREDLSDWMSFHHNEKNEWLRYGAAIYLDKCDGFLVQACRATGGQNGLLVARSDNGQAIGNNFSFLSGVGLGLYRASSNRVLHNKLDWCVRGYSHGVYNRGQDSAAILAFEQCNKNVFAYNSATHGGDGFFLWAGQTTMDTGQGGCNDNLIYGNDFSHSPTNGIEVTFSRNTIANNLIMECWHGIWGGYSYDTRIINNTLALNAYGIAIEHGQNNVINYNRFSRENEAIYLWQNKTQDPNWAYPKNRDTRSYGYQIADNYFDSIFGKAINLRDTSDVIIASNRIHSRVSVATEGTINGLQTQNNLIFDAVPSEIMSASNNKYAERSRPFRSATILGGGSSIVKNENNLYQYRLDDIFWYPRTYPSSATLRERTVKYFMPTYDKTVTASALKNAPQPIEGMPFLKLGTLRGRRYILVDEWGPYDFRSPMLWPREPSVAVPNMQTFEILGPPGTWKVRTIEGATLSTQTGTVPGFVSVTFDSDAKETACNARIGLEYVGETTTDFRGVVTPKGEPVAFGYSRFVAPIAWAVKWYKWDAKAADITPEGWPTVKTVQALADNGKAEPIAQTTTDTLELAGNGAFLKDLPPDHYATVAKGTFRVPTGDYVLEATTDDGCFVWVDDKPVVTNAWKYQGPTAYTADLTLAAGEHKIRVCHFQIDGYAALQIKLRPR